MKFFIDTANVDEIREANTLGLLDGVTTNPSLLAREADKGTATDTLKEICSIVSGPVSAEVVSLDMRLEDSRVVSYRSRLKLSFKYES